MAPILMVPKPEAMEPEIKGFTTDKLVMVVVPIVLVPVNDEVPVTARLLKVAVPVKVGESEKTTGLVFPVLVDKAVYRLAEVNDPSNVALPVEVMAPVKLALVVTVPAVRPEAVPVKLVATPLLGVPRAPLKVTNAPADPTLILRAVRTPVPAPVRPVLIGRPVAFVRVKVVGIPKFGDKNVGELVKATDPVPDSSERRAARPAEVVKEADRPSELVDT